MEDYVEKLKKAIRDMQVYSPEAKFLMESSKEMAKIRELWYDALSDAVDNFNGRISDAKLAESETVIENAENKKSSIEGGGRYSIRYPTYSNELLQKNAITVANMKPVYIISTHKLEKSGKKPSEIFEEFFNSWGYNIYSDEFGDIAVRKSSIKSEVRHGITAEKIASIEAIPTVIEKGKTIFSKKKSNSDVDRIVVAAPIKIGTTPYFMGVMLQRDSQNQRLYLHNVAIEKETSNNSQADLHTTGADENNDRLFITNILQKLCSVKHSNADFFKNPSTDTDKRSSKRIKTEESARSIIAGALESVATTDKERGILSRYKEKLGEMEAKATELKLKRGELHELVYTKGKRTAEATARIASLSEEIKKLEASVRAFDERLLRMESTQFLRELVMSHRKQGWAEASKKYREKIHQGVENRGRKAGHLFY